MMSFERVSAQNKIQIQRLSIQPGYRPSFDPAESAKRMLANQIPLRVMPHRISSQLLMSEEKLPRHPKLNETFRADEERGSNETSIHLWGYSPDFAAKKVVQQVDTVSRFSVGASTEVELVAKVKQAMKQGSLSTGQAAELVDLAMNAEAPAAEPTHFDVF
jgi:hypothetical protein